MTVLDVRDLEFSIQPHFWTPKRQLLRGVSLSVEAGEIFGFLGPNGAGKTTTIKSILGLIKPDRGSVQVFGDSIESLAVRRKLGFMPENTYFPEQLTSLELVTEHAKLAGLSSTEARGRAGEVLERVGLGHAMTDHLKVYSKGMLQRAGLAQALVGNPELVILDEPMSGLDPIGRREIREIMLELRERGKTVFFSTHILPDVELVCDRVALLFDGRVRKQGTLSHLLDSVQSNVEIQAEGCKPDALSALTALGAEIQGHERG
ncbi:MAG: ABC transporter ATP-binding protein, partial [Myxococcota bacterium]|nr:ABC transporter ATP-binding protein [Myxococcota bacterium]